MNAPHYTVEDQGFIRRIMLDRPDCRNGLTPSLALALTEAVTSATDKRVIVLGGRNGAFCSGLDLRVAMELGPALLENAEEHLAGFQALANALVTSPAVVVAAIDGAAAGFGCDLALAADLRIASERAFFQHTFSRIGLVPDGGGTWLLPRIVGLAKALEITLLAERVEAKSALELGLVSKVVAVDAFDSAVTSLANKLAHGPPMAFGHIKRLMRDAMNKPWSEGQRDEGQAQLQCLRSSDCMEGIMAFFAKRPAEFTGA
ncbi:MAG: enoyl-CoA hydratase-related protein [Deltaproteobacteria bacterium]|nr:enoyl-CoA hydratase-related protein [Deltaproteobacteria bacterium]